MTHEAPSTSSPPSSVLGMSEDVTAEAVVLRLRGELDMAGAPELLARVGALVDGGTTRVLVDLTELSFCDSAGLNAFIRGDRAATRAGGWLRLTGARGHVARVIELSGVLPVLGYRPDATA
jgi:anti-sigma B factor antagonist